MGVGVVVAVRLTDEADATEATEFSDTEETNTMLWIDATELSDCIETEDSDSKEVYRKFVSTAPLDLDDIIYRCLSWLVGPRLCGTLQDKG